MGEAISCLQVWAEVGVPLVRLESSFLQVLVPKKVLLVLVAPEVVVEVVEVVEVPLGETLVV